VLLTRFSFAFFDFRWYNTHRYRGCRAIAGVFFTLEESPSTIGQGAGEMPAEATLGKVQQRYTAKPRPFGCGRKDGKVR